MMYGQTEEITGKKNIIYKAISHHTFYDSLKRNKGLLQQFVFKFSLVLEYFEDQMIVHANLNP